MYVIVIFVYNRYLQIYIFKNKQEVQGLQAFPFFVVTVNDEHMKPRLKRKHRG